MAQHYLFQDRATYVRLYMLHGDDAGYLRPPFGPAWEQHLADFDLLLRGMAEKAHQRGVPMVLVDAPSMVQVALLSENARSYGADPFAFGQRLAAIATRDGVSFIDALTGFSKNAPAEKLFYPVDGHMNAAGSAVFAGILQRRLPAIEGTPFAACRSDHRTTSRAALR